MRCEAELCRNWTGQGCICEVMDLDPDVVEPLNYSTGLSTAPLWGTNDPCDWGGLL
jgi:hypothetical protein